MQFADPDNYSAEYSKVSHEMKGKNCDYRTSAEHFSSVGLRLIISEGFISSADFTLQTNTSIVGMERYEDKCES